MAKGKRKSAAAEAAAVAADEVLGGVQVLADAEPDTGDSEKKRYLDYDGLAYLVSKLTDKIEAVGGGGGTAQGVYVAYTDSDGVNRICKPSDWGSSLGTPCGALIVAGGRVLLVSPEVGSGSNSERRATGAYTVDDYRQAMNDFDGRGNTDAALASMPNPTDEYNYYYVNGYSYGTVGAGKWWLPALGELSLIYRHFSDVSAVAQTLSGTALSTTSYYWSSTKTTEQEGEWGMYMSNGSAYANSDGDNYWYTLRVSEWVWMDD